MAIEDVGGERSSAVGYGFLAEHRAFVAAIGGRGERPQPDFNYGVDFMRLVQEVLDAPSGSHRVVRDAPPVVRPAKALECATISTTTRGRTTRPTVFIHHPPALHARFFSPELLAALKAQAEVRTWSGGDQLGAELDGAQVVITGRGAPSLNGGRLQSAADLELLVVLGASVARLEPELLLNRGVAIANTADAVAQSVAEHCLMVSLAALRRLTEADRIMHRGGWPRPGQTRRQSPTVAIARRLLKPAILEPPARATLRALRRVASAMPASRVGQATTLPWTTGSDLRGEVVGLIGWGHTARHFARLLQPFDCEILVASGSGRAVELEAVGARRVSLGEVLGASRLVSLHKGLTNETRGFIGRSELAQLRPGSALVNTARAGLIDDEALLDRLSKGDIVAALDVFAEEPLASAHPFRRLDNVILTPHNASSTVQEDQRMGDQALETVLAWIDGRQVDVIDAARLANMS